MNPLSEEQKSEACTVAALGCDRQIIARYLGVSPAEMQHHLGRDSDFARRLTQAEARAELLHLTKVREAAQEEKNWRAAVWWLERRAPDRYARRDAGSLTPTQVRRFVDTLTEAIAEEVKDPDDRQRLIERLQRLTEDSMPQPYAINDHQSGDEAENE
ncbi:MAG: hypothetical protein AAGJ46_07740 [Planctomycetota bacterium]